MTDPKVKVTGAQVVLKESSRSVIVKDDKGKNDSLDSVSPEISKGDKGLIVEMDGKKFFVREPYEV